MNNIEEKIKALEKPHSGFREVVDQWYLDEKHALAVMLRRALEQRDELHAKCCDLRAGHGVLLIRKLSSYDAALIAAAQEVAK